MIPTLAYIFYPLCCSIDMLIISAHSFRPQPIMLKFLPIVLLSSAQKITHYAQKYAHIISSMPANLIF